MSAVLMDYVTRVQGGDRVASWQTREQTWCRWEHFRQTHCQLAAPKFVEIQAPGIQDASSYL